MDKRREWLFYVCATLSCGLVLSLCWSPVRGVKAKPSAPEVFCGVYGDSLLCKNGHISCQVCHAETPPGMNPFGQQVAAQLLVGTKRPLSHDDFVAGLKDVLLKIGAQDADGDGVSNMDEIKAGYLPGDKNHTPAQQTSACDPSKGMQCGYVPENAFKKVSQDFCGQQVSFEELEAFRKKEDQRAAIKEKLASCLDTPFWNGKDGVVWSLANQKIRPAKYAKSGADSGAFPIADYYEDYNIFVYSQIDDHDARLVLTAQFFVDRKDGTPTTYSIRQKETVVGSDLIGNGGFAMVQNEKRAGLATSPWTLAMITMFSVIPRGTAAQIYRSYLGLDIAKQEGLFPARNEPADYDDKGVREAACRQCHETLDALAYPFTRYNGLNFEAGKLTTYIDDRMKLLSKLEGPRLELVPEAGYIFGKRVKNLVEWTQVAVNSDQFAKAAVMDYWKLLMGGKPAFPKENAAFDTLWRDFRGKYKYSIERMLHAFVQMEVYGAY